MKIKSHILMAAMSAAAVVVIPNAAQAGGHRGGVNRSTASVAFAHPVGAVKMSVRGAGSDGRGRGRGRGKDDGPRHNVRDNHQGLGRGGADDPPGHDAGDDNRRHRRGRGH